MDWLRAFAERADELLGYAETAGATRAALVLELAEVPEAATIGELLEDIAHSTLREVRPTLRPSLAATLMAVAFAAGVSLGRLDTAPRP